MQPPPARYYGQHTATYIQQKPVWNTTYQQYNAIKEAIAEKRNKFGDIY